MNGDPKERPLESARSEESPADWRRRAKELFLAAREVADSERSAWLAEVAADDPGLKDEVLSMKIQNLTLTIIFLDK